MKTKNLSFNLRTVISSCMWLLLVHFPYSSVNAQTFSYDVSGRIVQADYYDGTTIKYKYDAAGNLKKAKVIPAITASINAEEPNGSIMRFNMHRTGDLSQVLSVSLSADGDAVNGQDYSSLPASVTFPAHESSVSFSVTVRSERPASAAKKLVVSLADSNDYGLDKHSSVTVTLPEKK